MENNHSANHGLRYTCRLATKPEGARTLIVFDTNERNHIPDAGIDRRNYLATSKKGWVWCTCVAGVRDHRSCKDTVKIFVLTWGPPQQRCLTIQGQSREWPSCLECERHRSRQTIVYGVSRCEEKLKLLGGLGVKMLSLLAL